MIKGCRKNMIMVPGGADSVFESVYFVLRSDVKQESDGEGDMVAEANRIVKELEGCESEGNKSASKWKRSLLFFAAGAVTGGGVTVLLFLLG